MSCYFISKWHAQITLVYAPVEWPFWIMLKIHFSLLSSEKQCHQTLFALSVKPFVPSLLFAPPDLLLTFLCPALSPRGCLCGPPQKGSSGFRLGSARAPAGDRKAGGEWAPFLQGCTGLAAFLHSLLQPGVVKPHCYQPLGICYSSWLPCTLLRPLQIVLY